MLYKMYKIGEEIHAIETIPSENGNSTQTDRLTQIHGQIDRQTDRLTDRQIGRQTDRQTDR